MMGKKRISITLKGTFVLIFLFSIILTTCPSFGNELFEIEPGWRVGPVIMTMTADDIQKIFGTAAVYVIPDVDRKVKIVLYQYKQIGLDFFFKNDQLEIIEINYPNYSIKGLVKVGSSTEKVVEALGDAYIQENFKHSTQVDIPDYKMIYDGVTFYVKSNRVIKIAVTRKK